MFIHRTLLLDNDRNVYVCLTSVPFLIKMQDQSRPVIVDCDQLVLLINLSPDCCIAENLYFSWLPTLVHEF